MKRYLIILWTLSLLLLCGCRGDLYAIYRDVERLRPIQTMGLDREAGQIVMSAAGPEPDRGAPFALCEAGQGIPQALTNLQNSFPEAEPYYAHVEYFLLGETAAQEGILPWLEWMERNPQMRLDTGIYIVQGTAAELILGASGSDTGSTERLESLSRELESLGEGMEFTVRDLAVALAEQGGALCGVVRAMDQREIVKNEDAMSVLPAGFGILKEDRLVEYIGEDEAPGVLLLLGRPQGARVAVETADAGTVTLLLDSGSVKHHWQDGVLQIEAELFASIVAMESTEDPSIPALNEALAQEALHWLEQLLLRTQRLNCDFLGLCEGREPASLGFEIQVTADVERSYDLREGDKAT